MRLLRDQLTPVKESSANTLNTRIAGAVSTEVTQFSHYSLNRTRSKDIVSMALQSIKKNRRQVLR